MRTFFNHEWLESIEGFVTLEVTGRENLDIDLDSEESVLDGSYLISKRVPARPIVVRFAIGCNRDEYPQKIALLKRILNTSDEEVLLFDDENDKYFKAILKKVDIDKEFQSAVTGSITFARLDPHKYATERKHFLKQNGKIVITNQGNVPAPIDYRVTINGNSSTSECGYVGLVSDEGAIEYGSLQEMDKQVVITEKYVQNRKSASEIMSMISGYVGGGSLAIKTFDGLQFACPVSNSGSGWHGPNFTLGVPADKDLWMASTTLFSGDADSAGALFIQVKNGSTVLVEVNITKQSSSASAVATVNLPSVSETVGTVSFAVGEGNIYAPFRSKASLPFIEIRKSGKNITVIIAGTVFSASRDEWETTTVDRISFYFYDFETTKKVNMGLRELVVKVMNYQKEVEYVNRFAKGDVLEISGDESRMRKNGQFSVNDEIIGTEYFKAPVGNIEVTVNQSSWAAPVDAEAWIRERWL